MGILDIFGGGSPEEKAKKLKAKAMQKYGDMATRQKALAQLGELKHPEAVRSLMARFTITVDPHTVDSDEKDHVFELVKAFGQDAVGPVKEFLHRSDVASSWALRLLQQLLPEDEVIGVAISELEQIGAEYTRDPEKKTVLIHSLGGKTDPRVGPALLPFLDDPADDVKLAALAALAPLKFDPAREVVMRLIVGPDVARRVKAAAIVTAHQGEFGVQGYREKVEAELSEPYFVDKAGLIKKRG